VLGVSAHVIKSGASNAALLISYLCVASTSSTIFQTPACHDLEGDLSYLKAGHSFSCATSAYSSYRTYAWFMALAHTSSLDTDLTRNTRAPHFTPQHWLLCHMGLY